MDNAGIDCMIACCQRKLPVVTCDSFLVQAFWWWRWCGGGDMAFFSHESILGECSTIHYPPVLFSKVEINSSTLIPLFML